MFFEKCNITCCLLNQLRVSWELTFLAINVRCYFLLTIIIKLCTILYNDFIVLMKMITLLQCSQQFFR